MDNCENKNNCNGVTKQQVVTHGLFYLGIRLRHLQKQSLPRKTFIFALQMSNKIIALLVIFR